MLKLPPPIWAAIYVLLAAVVSRLLGGPTLPGLPFEPLGVSLVAVAWIPSLWAFILFRREGTEINPTSTQNRKLVTGGPYRFTRNPMYLGLVVLTLGIAIWVGSWPFFLAPMAVFATASIFPSRKRRCAASLGRRTTAMSSGCDAGCKASIRNS
jgi:protein-S-isoprenylcysteine O-methyltransferase Ste14